MIDDLLVRTWNIADTYYTWAASYGIGPANADDDGDGTRNGHEFVLQFDPTNPVETFALRLVSIDEKAGRVDLQIAYLKPNGIYRLYSADTPTTDPSQATLRTEITPATATAGMPVSLTSGTPIPAHQFYFLHFEREE